jgi:hypothetical protein
MIFPIAVFPDSLHGGIQVVSTISPSTSMYPQGRQKWICGNSAFLPSRGFAELGRMNWRYGHCNTYLKLFDLDSNPEAEAFADELAAISLDLLMSDKPYRNGGINLFQLREQSWG